MARKRLKARLKCVRTTLEVVAFVDARPAGGGSPDQVSGRMKGLGKPSVSHEAICRHAWLDKAKDSSLHRLLQHSAFACTLGGASNGF